MSSWIQRVSSSSPAANGSARSTVPRRPSAPSRSRTPSKATIHRPWWGEAETRVRSPRSVENTNPGVTRSSGRLVIMATITSPLSPWGLTICPTSSTGLEGLVDDVDRRVDVLTGAGGPDHGADGLGHPAPPSDHPAHVGRRHVEAQHHRAAALVDLDVDRVLVVDDGAGEVVE